MWLILPWIFLAFPALVALVISVWNLATWPRGESRDTAADERPISVLIPARNEHATIEDCVRAAASSTPAPDEIVVYDDRSTDGTSSILADLRDEFQRDDRAPDLRVIQGEPLPDGWVGKPHACHQLADHADGDTLVFVDADTQLEPDGIGRLLSLMASDSATSAGAGPDDGAELVSAVPRQLTGSFIERLAIPLLHLTYTSWLPQTLVYRSDDTRFLSANGQIMAVDRTTLEDVGGFESVRRDVVDDMALARRFKQRGHTVVFADGFHIARCRMYTSGAKLVRGFSKNLYEGIGSSPVALAGVISLYLCAFFAPYAGLATALATGIATPITASIATAAATGVAANLTLRGLLTWRFDHPIEGIALHPFAILVFVFVALNSFLWHARDAVEWSGRTYPSRSGR